MLIDIVRNSNNIVFFGGAGVSTESNIPDFRSEKGLLKAKEVYGHPPEHLLSYGFFLHNPKKFFSYYKDNLIYSDALPNAAHLALAKMEEMGKVSAVITQNIDGLHQAAGSKNVIELHGSNYRHYCMDCKETYSLSYVLDDVNGVDLIPRCKECEGIVRPDVVLYGESLDEDVMIKAIDAIFEADCIIVGGTSLAVYPAAGLLQYFRGNKRVLINKGETPYDSSADLVINDSIGKVLGEIITKL